MKTKNYIWIIPALIVAVNAIAVLARWHSLPETLKAHFDLQGNASGTMPRSTLIFYPIASAVICLFAYVKSRMKSKRVPSLGLAILASGVALAILSSTLVTLTEGTKPIFMLAEPVIMVIALVAFFIIFLKARRNSIK